MSWFIFFLIQIWIGLLALALYLFDARSAKYKAADPAVILALITAALLPFIAVPFWPRAANHALNEIMVNFAAAASLTNASQKLSLPDFVAALPLGQMALALYVLTSLVLIARRLAPLSALYKYHVVKSEIFQLHHVRIVDGNIPPCSTAWPSRYIYISAADYQALSSTERGLIYSHEAAHLKQRDPEITLLLILINSLLWINPAFGWLVNRWRHGAELRADAAALNSATRQTRKDYGQLLLRLSQNHTQPQMPCPAATLSKSARPLKERLDSLMTPTSTPNNFRRKCALLISALALSFFGTSLIAAAGHDAVSAPDLQPIKKVPPIMPGSCAELEASAVKIKTAAFNTGNSYQYAEVGNVNLVFDVNPNGKPHNIKISQSNSSCYHNSAKAAVGAWEYPASKSGYKDIEVKITYRLTGDSFIDGTSLEDILQKYSKAK